MRYSDQAVPYNSGLKCAARKWHLAGPDLICISIPFRSPDGHGCILVLKLSLETGILVIVVADICSY